MSAFLATLRARSLAETDSGPLNAEYKEMEENKAYMSLIAKKLKKSNKSLKDFIAAGAQVSIGMAQYSNAVMATRSDSPLGAALEKGSMWEYYMGDLLNTLMPSLELKVSGGFLDFTKNDMPVAQTARKKFDTVRREYDASIIKVQTLEKDKKPNQPKIQQAAQERDRMKQTYLQAGEEAMQALLDVNDMADFQSIEKVCTYFDAWYQFFKGGFQWLREFHDTELQQLKKHVSTQKANFDQRKRQRSPGEWIPDAISGGASIRTRMFGMPYDEIIRRDNPAGGIPPFLSSALDFLETKGLDTQGIFRVSPPKSALDELKKKIDQGKPVDWNIIDDVHTVTGTFKLFLRELPQPLLTFELYSEFVGVGDLNTEENQVKVLMKVLGKLPKGNFALLRRLIRLCVLIEQNKDLNKMTASNLSVVLCPSILYSEEPNPLTMVEDIEKANRLMALMVNNYTTVFGEPLPKAGPAGPRPTPPPATNPAPPQTTPAPPTTNPVPPPTTNPVPPPATTSAPPVSPGASLQFNPQPAMNAPLSPRVEPVAPTGPPRPTPPSLTSSQPGAGAPPSHFAAPSPDAPTAAHVAVAAPVPVQPTPQEQPASSAEPEPAAETSAPAPSATSTRGIPKGAMALPGMGGAMPTLRDSSNRISTGTPNQASDASAESQDGNLRRGPSKGPPPRMPSSAKAALKIAMPGLAKAPSKPLDQQPAPAAPAGDAAPAQPASVQPAQPPVQSAQLTPQQPAPQQPPTASTQNPVTEPVPVVAGSAPREFSLQQIRQHLGQTPPMPEHFYQLAELAEALMNFSTVSAKPSLGADDYASLNDSLRGLARAIKASLQVGRDFGGKLPEALGNRILLGARGLQEQIVPLATAFKQLNPEDMSAAPQLVEALKLYIAAEFTFITRVKETALVDPVSLVVTGQITALQSMLRTFSTAPVDRGAIASATNSLQMASFKFTALIRSKVMDVASQQIQQVLTSYIESTEKSTAELSAEVKTVLFDMSKDPQLSETMMAKIQSLSAVAQQCEALVEILQPQNNPSVFNLALYQTTVEQLNANIIAHSQNTNAVMQQVVRHLAQIMMQIRAMAAASGPNDALTDRFSWLTAAHQITKELESIGKIVGVVKARCPEPTMLASLDDYETSMTMNCVLAKLAAAALAYGTQSPGQEGLRYMTSLKDAIFLSFPSLFVLRDAITMAEMAGATVIAPTRKKNSLVSRTFETNITTEEALQAQRLHCMDKFGHIDRIVASIGFPKWESYMVKGCVARAAQLCRLNGLTAKSHAITCAVLITMDEYTPKDRKKRKRKVATQLLDDLTTRFIINIPDEEFESIERICFQIELAHWFYEDFHRAKDPSLPKLTLEEFAQVSSCCPSPQKQLSFLESLFQLTNLFGGLLVFDHVPLLQPLKDDVEEIISQFKEYKTKVPVYGAIILNSTLDRVLLVKGYTSRSSWGFPKGKINKDEREIDCAAREVYEEIGYDLTPHLREPDHIEVVIREQKIKLYIVAGIPEDTIFEPKTRKEISKIEWFPVEVLPVSFQQAKDRQAFADGPYSGNSYYMVIPFMPKLLKWISKYGKRRIKEQNKQHHSSNAMIPTTPSSLTGTNLQKTPSLRGKTLQSGDMMVVGGTNLMNQFSAAAAATNGPPRNPLLTFRFDKQAIMSCFDSK